MVPRIRRPPNYRRRPPRAPGFPLISLVVSLVLLACTTTGAAAQNVTTITDPSSTSVSLDPAGSAVYFLPSSSSTTPPVYISLSLCSIPSSLASNGSFVLHPVLDTVLYASTSPDVASLSSSNSSAHDDPSSQRGSSTASSKLSYGYANVTLTDGGGGGGGGGQGIYVAVFAPDTTDSPVVRGQWQFELEVSSGTTEPPYVAKGRVGLRTEDTDARSVLLSTAKRASDAGTPVVAPTSSLSLALSRSKCFVRMAAAQSVATGANLNTSTTTRGWPKDGMRTQFLVDGLERGSNYTAWFVENVTLPDGGGPNQTRVWDPVFFATKSSDSCRLVYDIDACPSVAYAVPAPTSLDTPSLVSFFNSTISASMTNFTRTMTTFPCDSDMGMYSVVSTCDDCINAYRDYLCAVTMPRCTDAPSNATLNDTTTSAWSSSDGQGPPLPSYAIPSDYTTSLVRTDPFASRTPLFGPSNLSTTFPSLFNSSYRPTQSNLVAESPFPYTETPPCLDVCYLVEARCPPFLGWTCPKDNDGSPGGGTGSAAYGVTRDVSAAERLAGDVKGSGLHKRAADRWGKVYCNALYSDLTMAAQFAPPSNAAPLSTSVPRTCLLVSLVVAVASMLYA